MTILPWRTVGLKPIARPIYSFVSFVSILYILRFVL